MSIVCSICGDHADALVVRDLIQQVRQDGRVTNPAACDLDGPDFQRFRMVVWKTVHWTVF